MLSAQAFVETDRASRYLVQACRHFSNQGRHLRGLGARHARFAGARPRGVDAGRPGAEAAGRHDAETSHAGLLARGGDTAAGGSDTAAWGGDSAAGGSGTAAGGSGATAGHTGAAARHSGADAGRMVPAVDVQVEWSDTDGLINFGWGRASLQATVTALVLRAEADSAEGLRRIQELLAGHLQRFGRRDHLTVTWQPTDVPGTAATAQS